MRKDESINMIKRTGKKVREQFLLLFLKDINWGRSNMCSKKNPRILRKTSKKDIVNFSLAELDNELKNKQVILHFENIHHLASHPR